VSDIKKGFNVVCLNCRFYGDKERSFVSDATGSIGTSDGKYRIGGRLIVQDAISICYRILPDIVQGIEKFEICFENSN
jgi:hypothetical protein